MSDVLSFRLREAEKARLDALSQQTGRPRTFYVREALDKYLDELEYVYLVRAEHEAVRRGELPVTSLEELERELVED